MRRLILLAVLVLMLPVVAGAQSSNGSFIQYSAPGLSSGGTITGPLLLPNGTAGAPSLAFSSDPDTGFYWGSTGIIYQSSNGSRKMYFGDGEIGVNNYFRIGSGGGLNWTSSADPFGGSTDVSLFRDAANTLAMRNSTNGQTFNVYNTYTDASNYQRAYIDASTAGNVYFGGIGLGAGGSVNTYLRASGSIGFFIASTQAFTINTAEGFYPAADDTYGVGHSSAKVRTAYLSRSIQGSKSKTLTDAAAAVSFVRIAVATNGYIGGRVIYTANSTDGTNRLTTTGEYFFAGADTAGTVTCGAPSAVGTPATAYRRANTLICAVTAATSTTNCDLQVTCTDNLAGDQTPTFEWRLDMPAPNTVTPQ